MESILELFKTGYGPSSSHTMGPYRAARLFIKNVHDASKIRVHLYGSLAATGRGHLTDVAITSALKPFSAEIIWHHGELLPFHPNGMIFEALSESYDIVYSMTLYSIGGGSLADEKGLKIPMIDEKADYPYSGFTEILKWTEKTGRTLWEYVFLHDDPMLEDYLKEVWTVMKDSIQRGIDNEGALPGTLNLARKAAGYFAKANGYKGALKRRGLVYSFALAVSEENAGGGKVVTAPTCGSSGVLPAVLYLLHKYNDFSESKIIRALATAGLIGNLVKHNASISGAEVGCQGEVGVACSMAAGAAAQLFGGTPFEIEYAAEMGLEHHLGLTCDPIGGYVQIPCIERNALAAARALDCCTFAILSDGKHRVSFDKIVEAMKQTGHDLPSIYKETSEGGIAALDGFKPE